MPWPPCCSSLCSQSERLSLRFSYQFQPIKKKEKKAKKGIHLYYYFFGYMWLALISLLPRVLQLNQLAPSSVSNGNIQGSNPPISNYQIIKKKKGGGVFEDTQPIPKFQGQAFGVILFLYVDLSKQNCISICSWVLPQPSQHPKREKSWDQLYAGKVWPMCIRPCKEVTHSVHLLQP